MRSFSLGLSVGLHVALVFLGLALLSRPVDVSRPVRLLEVRIVDLLPAPAPPEPPRTAALRPAPEQSPVRPVPPPVQARPRTPAPPPPARADSEPPAQAEPGPPPPAEPPAMPGTAEAALPAGIPSENATARPRNDNPEWEAFARAGGLVRPEAADGLKHGAEARMAAFLTYDRHTVENYVGQYSYGGRNSLSIIDARSTPLGRLLLYDARTGLLRDLKPFNHYIHTYGPALGQDEPVEGSVTFLSKDGDIHRFIWMHGNATAAEFPAKNRLDESTVPLPVHGQTLVGTLVRPLEGGPFPAVALLGDPAGMSRTLLESCARQLALAGLAVLALAGGEEDGWSGENVAVLAQAAVQALDHLRGQAWAVPGRVGLAGVNGGAAVLARAAALAQGKGPDFTAVFLEAGEAGPVRTGLTDALVRGIAAPSLWILAGPQPRTTWRGELDRLGRCGRPLSTNVLTVPLEPEPGATGWAGQALLVDRAGSVFARLAGPWIQQGR